jgi:hypothetical protein
MDGEGGKSVTGKVAAETGFKKAVNGNTVSIKTRRNKRGFVGFFIIIIPFDYYKNN